MCRPVVAFVSIVLLTGSGCADREIVWAGSHGGPGGDDSSGDSDHEPDTDSGPLDPDMEPPDVPPPPPAERCDDGRADDDDLCLEDRSVAPAGIDPCSIDVGDLDGDGHLDVLVPNSDFGHLHSDDNVVTALFGDGTGSLGRVRDYLAGGDVPVGIAVGHLDRDGNLDVVSVSHEAAHAAVLQGRGGGALTAPALFSTGPSPSRIAIADLDADGITDLAVANSGAGSVSLFFGSDGGEAAFSPASEVRTGGFGNMSDCDVADLDRDGAPDILLANSFGGVFVARGLTGRRFAVEPVDTDVRPTSVAAGDLDGDGWLDLVATDSRADAVRLYRGQGDGTVAPCTTAYSDPGPSHLVLEDMDQDGRLDIVVANTDADSVAVLLGDGACGVRHRRTFDVGSRPPAVATGDFNGDGLPDIAVAHQLDNEVGLILSNP